MLGITAAGFDVESSCWRDTADPSLAGAAYASPTAWLRSQQLSSPPADAGRIASPNDSFGVNTFATSQTVEGLLQSWLPIVRASASTCTTPPPPTTTPTTTTPTTSTENPVTPGQPVVAGAVVTATPRFTG